MIGEGSKANADIHEIVIVTAEALSFCSIDRRNMRKLGNFPVDTINPRQIVIPIRRLNWFEQSEGQYPANA